MYRVEGKDEASRNEIESMKKFLTKVYLARCKNLYNFFNALINLNLKFDKNRLINF